MALRIGATSSWLIAPALSLVACLPADTRPPPGTVHATVEPSGPVVNGFSTADGWNIRFERLLLGIGNVDLEGDTCNSYADTHYDRLFDFVVTERHKLGLVRGLGMCSIEFRTRAPSSDVVLGPGATQDDVAFMRVRATDPYADDSRATMVVRGEASKDGTTKRFEWIFRDSYELSDCTDENGATASVIDIGESESHSFPLVVYGEEMFRPLGTVLGAEPEPLRFDDFAAADTDEDGTITLDELTAAPAPEGWVGGVAGDGAGGAGGEGTPSGEVGAGGGAAFSLGSFLYTIRVPSLVRLQGGGACIAEERGRGR